MDATSERLRDLERALAEWLDGGGGDLVAGLLRRAIERERERLAGGNADERR